MTVRASSVIATHTQGGFVDFMAWSLANNGNYQKLRSAQIMSSTLTNLLASASKAQLAAPYYSART